MPFYCRKCGNEVERSVRFCGKCGSEINEETIKEISVEKMLAAIDKQDTVEKKAYIYESIGHAYENALYGAEKDLEKAKEYYREGAMLGSLSCAYEWGRMIVILNINDPDLTVWTLGVALIINCYKRGLKEAEATLQMLIDDRIFKNCNSINDLLSMTVLMENAIQ